MIWSIHPHRGRYLLSCPGRERQWVRSCLSPLGAGSSAIQRALAELLITGYTKFIPTEILVVGAELRKCYAHFNIVNQLYSNKNFKKKAKVVKKKKENSMLILMRVNEFYCLPRKERPSVSDGPLVLPDFSWTPDLLLDHQEGPNLPSSLLLLFIHCQALKGYTYFTDNGCCFSCSQVKKQLQFQHSDQLITGVQPGTLARSLFEQETLN